jgi:hypothetical protein
MAVIDSKRSIPAAQASARESRKTKSITNKKTAFAFHPIAGKRGRAAIARSEGRRFYRIDKVRGQIVDFVEFYTTGEYHCLDLRFQDKTSLSFVIEPGFTLETEHSDWKTGNWKPIDKWPLVRSQRL